jgi:Fe-S-cluster containining protein
MNKFCKNCKDCCCSHDNGGTFTTLHEALRIAKAQNIPVDEICEFVADNDLKSDDDYLNYYNLFVKVDDKILPLAYKRHLLILKKKGRDCIFLNGKGCTIPNLRPAYKRLVKQKKVY